MWTPVPGFNFLRDKNFFLLGPKRILHSGDVYVAQKRVDSQYVKQYTYVSRNEFKGLVDTLQW